MNAGGEAEVSATESVDAKTRAGGNITVYGNPADKKTKKLPEVILVSNKLN